MPDWDKMQEQAKQDVKTSLETWVTILTTFWGSRLKFAYAKGSSVKSWDSIIDYVPVISDTDIHVMLIEDEPLFPDPMNSFNESLQISKMYEKEFLKRTPHHLHIPRSQVISINHLKQVVDYVPPRGQDVHMLFGTFEASELPSDDVVRKLDLEHLFAESEFLADFPRQLFDRVGLDYWSLLRRMLWKVSPAPVRLLTQLLDDPYEVWSWNRTKITEELKVKGYDAIAQQYRLFYESGWDLFLSGFNDGETYRKAITSGYFTIRSCVDEAKKLSS
jgi:hypothetical protein